MHSVQTDEEVKLFWELYPDFTRGRTTDFAAMAREWNLRVGQGVRTGTCDLYLKEAAQLKAFQRELAEQLCVRDTTSLHVALAARPRPAHASVFPGVALQQDLPGGASGAAARRPSVPPPGLAPQRLSQAGPGDAMAALMRGAAATAARRPSPTPAGSAVPVATAAPPAATSGSQQRFAGQVPQAGRGGAGVSKQCRSCKVRGIQVVLSNEHRHSCKWRIEDGIASEPPKKKQRQV